MSLLFSLGWEFILSCLNCDFMVKELIVLGAGCVKCKKVYSVVEKVVAETGVETTLRKEEDIMKIITYDVMTTPAVVVDGVVKFAGYVPTEVEVKQALGLQ